MQIFILSFSLSLFLSSAVPNGAIIDDVDDYALSSEALMRCVGLTLSFQHVLKLSRGLITRKFYDYLMM